jgi:hypothetical protein
MRWTPIRMCGRALVATALALLRVAAATQTAWAAPAEPPGHDVSHPECDGEFPADSAFGIVGINRGRPFSANPCLAAQYRWATGRPNGAAVYVNTSNPAPSSPYYWPRSGSADPALCRDSTSTTDPGCAYNYGWHAAANAAKTGKTLGRAVLGHTWWLDVETSNTWNGDPTANTAVLQGMYDYLRSHGVAKVGLYSTSYQWQKITGGYTAASADRYRTAWAPTSPPTSPCTTRRCGSPQPVRSATPGRCARRASPARPRRWCRPRKTASTPTSSARRSRTSGPNGTPSRLPPQRPHELLPRAEALWLCQPELDLAHIS